MTHRAESINLRDSYELLSDESVSEYPSRGSDDKFSTPSPWSIASAAIAARVPIDAIVASNVESRSERGHNLFRARGWILQQQNAPPKGARLEARRVPDFAPELVLSVHGVIFVCTERDLAHDREIDGVKRLYAVGMAILDGAADSRIGRYSNVSSDPSDALASFAARYELTPVQPAAHDRI